MMMLRTNRPDESQIFNTILKVFLAFPFHYLVFCNNFEFIMAFFRAGWSDKEIGYQPQLSSIHLMKNYNNDQISYCFKNLCGNCWSELDVMNCMSSVLKLGINDINSRILRYFITLFKNCKKYHSLLSAY
jgi:hypothetical protein